MVFPCFFAALTVAAAAPAPQAFIFSRELISMFSTSIFRAFSMKSASLTSFAHLRDCSPTPFGVKP